MIPNWAIDAEGIGLVILLVKYHVVKLLSYGPDGAHCELVLLLNLLQVLWPLSLNELVKVFCQDGVI